MPAPGGAVLPFLLGSTAGAVARTGLQRFNRWADSRYISGRPIDGPSTATSARMKRYRSYTRTTTKRRKRSRRRGVIRRRIPRAITSPAKLIRAKAVYTHALTSSTASAATVISMMDITDPFVGSSNAQPLGYDQWKGLYNKAYVVGIKVSFIVHNKGTTAVMFGITPLPESQGSTGLSAYQHYMEMPVTKSRLLSPDVDHGFLSAKYNTRKWLHLSSLKDEDAFHCDLDGETSPTRDAKILCWIGTVDGSTTNTTEGTITVDYLIRLYDPIVPARSSDS